MTALCYEFFPPTIKFFSFSFSTTNVYIISFISQAYGSTEEDDENKVIYNPQIAQNSKRNRLDLKPYQ